jgi:hypothetical protein
VGLEPKTYNWSPMIDDYDINYGAIIVSCTWESTMCIGCKVTYTRRMVLNFGLDIPLVDSTMFYIKTTVWQNFEDIMDMVAKTLHCL